MQDGNDSQDWMNMKTGSMHDGGDEGDYLESDTWSPWQWHAPEEEFQRYVDAANSMMMRLDRMPPALRKKIKQIGIRCPVNGCRLATVYWLPRHPTSEEADDRRRMAELRDRGTIKNSEGETVQLKEYMPGNYIYVGRTAGGTEVYDIMTYGFSATPRDDVRGCTCCRIVYWRAGCRHGTATLDRNSLIDMFMMAERVHNVYYTEEQAVAQLPDHLRPFWGKRTFHPDAKAWHPKKLKPRTRQVLQSGRVPINS
jgi:hypothetical protein